VILLKKPKLQLKDLQETPSVEVEDRSDYLRSGNVKLDYQSLKLRYQEEGSIVNNTCRLGLPREISWDYSR
jgi:hypothetical protein